MFKFKDLSKEDFLRAFKILKEKGNSQLYNKFDFPGGSVEFRINGKLVEDDIYNDFAKLMGMIGEDAEENFVEEIRNTLTKDGEILYGFGQEKKK